MKWRMHKINCWIPILDRIWTWGNSTVQVTIFLMKRLRICLNFTTRCLCFWHQLKTKVIFYDQDSKNMHFKESSKYQCFFSNEPFALWTAWTCSDGLHTCCQKRRFSLGFGFCSWGQQLIISFEFVNGSAWCSYSDLFSLSCQWTAPLWNNRNSRK